MFFLKIFFKKFKNKTLLVSFLKASFYTTSYRGQRLSDLVSHALTKLSHFTLVSVEISHIFMGIFLHTSSHNNIMKTFSRS
jgi:hypothetical protein